MATASDTRSPDEIEREIQNTQAEMSRTVNQIGDQLSPRNVFNALLDKADENGVDARWLLEGARRNPLALGMIAIGGIWLVSDSDARASTLKPNWRSTGSGGETGAGAGTSTGWGNDEHDLYHRGYVEHMARCERRADEDDLAYRRRRDHARASYLMIEQRHDEDEHGFRQRLDEATERMRERRERLADSARESMHRMGEAGRSAGYQAREYGGRAASTARDLYSDNPLLGGLAAAMVGAVVGAALPLTRTEEDQLGGMGESALEAAKAKARDLGEQAREKKDELVDKADRQINESGGANAGAGTGATGGTGTGGTGTGGQDPFDRSSGNLNSF